MRKWKFKILAYHLDNLSQIPLGLQTTECPGKVQWLLKWSPIFLWGPPPVFLLSWRNFVNSLFAAEWRFFHFSRTSVSVRLSTPTAFTTAVISDHTCFFFKFVTLLVNLLCRMAKFSSTFSVKIEISEALKLCFLGFTGSHFSAFRRL